jgi:ABC-type branched-subunit amino acid transport system ATPase component
VLGVESLDAFYGDSHILHKVDLAVDQGARVALMGLNGAGKSTFLKGVMGAGPRTTGEIKWNGQSIQDISAFERVRLGISLVPEDKRIFGHLTVRENLLIAARAVGGGRRPREIGEIIASFPMLAPLLERPGSRMSGGQQQVLSVARALIQRPTLMLLDEPTEGLAPLIVEQLAERLVASCAETGTSLLLCEQNLWFARKCTSYLYIIESGRIVFKGDWTAFDQDESAPRKYLCV